MISANLTKSIFITIYAPTSIIGALLYAYYLGFSSFIDLWVAIVGLGTFPVLLGVYTIFKPSALTDPHLTILNSISCINLVWAIMAAAIGLLNISVLPAAIIGVIGNFCFTYWFSQNNMDNKSISISDILPSLTLYTNDHQAVTNFDILKQLKMLVFYRGTWCPICIEQLQYIRKSFLKLNNDNIHLYFICPEQDKPGWQPFPSSENIHFLYDRDQDTAEKLGISAYDGVPLPVQLTGVKPHTVIPCILLVNAKNQVVFTEFSTNFRVRPMQSNYAQYFEVLSR